MSDVVTTFFETDSVKPLQANIAKSR